MRRRRSSNVSLTGGLVNVGRPLSAEPSPPHYTDDALLVSRLRLRLITYVLNMSVLVFVDVNINSLYTEYVSYYNSKSEIQRLTDILSLVLTKLGV